MSDKVMLENILQEEHEAKMVAQAMCTLKEGIVVQERLHNVHMPDCQKAYLQSMYDGLMEKQEMLNRRIGVVNKNK